MITIYANNGLAVPYEILNFPDGETFVKLNVSENDELSILWKYENDGELFTLGLLVDIIENNKAVLEKLIIPYFPHARQDRATTSKIIRDE